MDPEIEELKRLVQKNIELSEDTNRVVHKLRRAAWWGRLWSLLWWGAILLISAGAYYYYVQPYLEQVLRLYEQVQNGAGQAQGWQEQIADFLGNFRAQ